MADLKTNELLNSAPEFVAQVKATTEKKTPGSRKTKGGTGTTARKSGATGKSQGSVSAEIVPTSRKIHSSRERADKLAHIAKAIKSGEPLKSAVKQAGISEPTYYQWKKAAAPAAASDELTDLLALEKENKRLKSMLAERLRKENAELKRKLGI